MNKKAMLALLLSCVLILSSCSLIVKDPDVDAATEIIKVADKVYTKAEVQSAVEYYHDQMEATYSNYGLSYDRTSANAITSAQNAVIDGLVQSAVISQKTAEYGADQLTEEEEAKIKEEWDGYYNMFKSIFFSDPGELTEEEIDTQVRYYISMYYGVTEEGMLQSAKNDKLKSIVVADVKVSDDEVKADYDAKVAAAKESYASNLSAYGTSVNGGESVYYRPAGYRMVKQILVKFSSEDQSVVDQLNSKITSENSTITTLTSSLSGVENLEELLSQVNVTVKPLEIERAVNNAAENAAEAAEAAAEAVEETAEAAAEAVEETVTVTVKDLETEITDTLSEELDEDTRTNIRKLAEANARISAYRTALAEATDKAYANLDPKVAEIKEKLAAGEDWDSLVAEYNEDPGMTAGRATAETGYAVCEGFASFDAAFTAAAMALENVGDVSEPTRGSSNGYYIIKYFAEVPEGDVDLAEVSEGIHSALLKTKQDEFYDETVEKWVKDANAFIDRNSLNN